MTGLICFSLFWLDDIVSRSFSALFMSLVARNSIAGFLKYSSEKKNNIRYVSFIAKRSHLFITQYQFM